MAVRGETVSIEARLKRIEALIEEHFGADRWVTFREAASRTRFGRATLYKLNAEREANGWSRHGVSRKVGSRWELNLDRLEDWRREVGQA